MLRQILKDQKAGLTERPIMHVMLHFSLTAPALAVNLNLGSHGPFDPESYHALPRQFFSPHGG